MCQYPASVTQQNWSASRERWCRRLILCLLGGLVIAFALLPDYLAAAPDNATTQPVTAEPASTQADKFKWNLLSVFRCRLTSCLHGPLKGASLAG